MVIFPELFGEQINKDGMTLSLRIPAELAYFDGHFEQIHIVPGVVQIQWAVHFARRFLMSELTFSHMESIKFKELLLPGQTLELRLRFMPATGKLEFCYYSPACEYSSGRLYFHDSDI